MDVITALPYLVSAADEIVAKTGGGVCRPCSNMVSVHACHIENPTVCNTMLSEEVQCRYNRQGRKAKNRRSRDSYSNRAYTRKRRCNAMYD